jgi:putative ABC transport system permease protein
LHVRGSKVTRQFFGAIGIQPMLGRGFTAEEDLPGGPQVVVISYGLWRSAFGSDAGIVGRSMPLNGTSYSIVGVLPPGFRFEAGDTSISNPDVLIPLQLSSEPADRGTNYMLIARMKPGTSLASAQSDTDRVASEFTRAYPDFFRGYSGRFPAIRVLPFQKSITGDVQRPLLILLAAVVFVLLIACVNVANLFLSRATARHREMAIRAALGASGRRLFGQILSESVVFAALAGVAGFALGAWGVRFLVALSPVDLPRIGELSVDWRVLVFTCALSLIVALACGSLAAFHARRNDVSGSLNDRSQAAAPSRTVSQMLVVGEIALSLMLLSGAALLIATMIHLYRVPMGFDASNVTSLRMSLFSDKYRHTAEVARFEQQVRERVSRLPGVVSASTASATPLERGLNMVAFRNGVVSGDPNNHSLIEYRSAPITLGPWRSRS